MRLPFQNLSIRVRLTLLATVSSSIAIVVACGGFAFHGLQVLRTAHVAQLRTEAEVLAFNCVSVLQRDDAATGHDLLFSLSSASDIQQAVLFNRDDKLLASFVRTTPQKQSSVRQVPDLDGQEYRFSADNRLEIVMPVRDGEDILGTLFLQVSTVELEKQMAEFQSVMLIVVGVSLLVALVLALALQTGIVRPVQNLAAVSQRISEEQDYSLRVEGDAGGELGTLYETFNNMLNQIQKSKDSLRTANSELSKARDVAEAANSAKSQWLANMSHEIRTPLNGLLGFTEFLRRGLDNGNEAERQDYVETIHRSGQHLLSLINDILDVSKIEAGHMSVEKVDCSPHQLIAEVISILRVRAVEKELSLTYQWQGPMPVSVRTDPSRLRQILMNLTGNAIKFTEQGAVQVLARIEGAADDTELVVEVTDTGIGIPEAKQQAVFEAFQQADDSVTRQFGGTGLGLSISQHLARILGGSLSLNSSPGEGSTFILRMKTGPIEVCASADTEATAECLINQSAQVDDVAGLVARVLVVDDGDINRKLVRLALQKKGADVEVACDGQEGLQAALSANFDLILMDMQMPVLDGYTATRELRRSGYTGPIIALTANAMQGDMQKCLDAGCTAYLTKPIDPRELVTVVNRTLAGSDPGANESGGDSAEAVFNTDCSLIVESTLPIDDPDYFEVVVEFLEQLDARLDELDQALAARDWKSLAAKAHWLKGVGGTAGFMCFVDPSQTLISSADSRSVEVSQSQIQVLRHLSSRLTIPESRG